MLHAPLAPSFCRHISYAMDIWAVGCTVIEMISGRPPWADVLGHMEPLAFVFRLGTDRSAPPWGV